MDSPSASSITSDGSLAAFLEINKLIQSGKFVGSKKAELLKMILSELDALETRSMEAVNEDIEIASDKVKISKAEAITYIPNPKPYKNDMMKASTLSELDTFPEKQRRIDRIGRLGTISLTSLYEGSSSDLNDVVLESSFTEAQDIENEQDYGFVTTDNKSCYNSNDNNLFCDNESVDNKDSDHNVIASNERTDGSEVDCSDSECTEDRARMDNYLDRYTVPIYIGIPEAVNKKENASLDDDQNVIRRNSYLKYEISKSSDFGSLSKSGSDVPSQSSGDDDEMLSDDEHYAQAIADWRQVLPLERSHMDKKKDEVRAHLSSDMFRTRNDFVESLVNSIQMRDADKDYPQNNIFTDTPDLPDLSRGAQILSTASPRSSPLCFDSNANQKLRCWEKSTATSRSRQRTKLPLQTCSGSTRKTCKNLTTLFKQKHNSTPKEETRINIVFQERTPDYLTPRETANSKFIMDPEDVDSFFLTRTVFTQHTLDSKHANKNNELNSFSNLAAILVAKQVAQEQAEQIAEEPLNDGEITINDIPLDFHVDKNRKASSKYLHETWSDESDEQLEVFLNNSASVDAKVINADILEVKNVEGESADLKPNGVISNLQSSLTLEEFILKYGDSDEMTELDKNAEDSSALFDFTTDKPNDSSIMLSVGENEFDFCSHDHLSPKNHPNVAEPVFPKNLTGNALLDVELRKALSTQTMKYVSNAHISSESVNFKKDSRSFKNIRVRARLNTSVDASGGGLPLAALEDDRLEQVPTSMFTEAAISGLDNLESKPLHSRDSSGSRDEVGNSNKRRTRSIVAEKIPHYKFGPGKSLQKRHLAKQAQLPTFTFLYDNCPTQLSTFRKRAIPHRFSDAFTALAQSAGLHGF